MGLQQLTGFTVPIKGRNADVYGWPVLQLGLTSGGIFVPLLVDPTGALVVDTSGGGTQSVAIGGPLGARAQSAAVATTPAIVGPTSEDVSIPSTEGGTQISPANANGRIVSIVNNGAFPLWIDYGGAAPVAETSPGDGTGRGIYVAPYGLWESPTPITTAVMGITTPGNTVSVRKTE